MDTKGLIAIAAAIAVSCGGLVALGQGLAAAKGIEAVGRNPEATSEIRSAMILGIALIETCAIYGLLVSMILIFMY